MKMFNSVGSFVRSTAFVLGFIFAAGCRVTPGPGEEAVLIKQPILPFFEEGVVSTPVKTGLTWVAPTTSSVVVNMQPQQYSVHLDDFFTSDGVPVDFDAIIRLRVIDSVRLVQGFGVEWYKHNVESEFITRIRQAVRKHGMNEVAIDTRAIDQIDQEITEGMTGYLKTAGLPVELIQVTVGRANPPDAVKSQRIKTAEEQQRALTENQRKLAEDQRRNAEMSRATADTAYRTQMGYSPEQYLQLEALRTQRQVCGPDKSNCTFVVGASMPGLVINHK